VGGRCNIHPYIQGACVACISKHTNQNSNAHPTWLDLAGNMSSSFFPSFHCLSQPVRALSLNSCHFTNAHSAPTSFCKCTCFSNSTIIPLSTTTSDRKTPANKPPFLFNRADSDSKEAPAHHARTCADCTKQFCLSYNLPICSTAKEENVFTTCFQRDSAKDQAVVFLFIGATVGLLVWSAVRPAYERWRDSRGYSSLGGGQGQ